MRVKKGKLQLLLFLALQGFIVSASESGPEEIGYWCGYRTNPESNITLDMLLEKPSVKQVRLAFVGPAADSTVDISYLCKNHSEETIKGWIKTLRAAGKKVTISFMDSSTVAWQNVDIKTFAQSLNQLVEDWDLSGIDIDGESSCSNLVETMITIAQECRAVLAKEKTISYTCYTCSDQDKQILTAIKDICTTVTTMDYFDNFDGMIQTAQFYANIVGKDKVSIGVKPGVTPLTQVAQLGPSVPQQGFKGIMVWSFDDDSSVYRDQKDWAWTDAVHESLQVSSSSAMWTSLWSPLQRLIWGQEST